MNPKEDAFYLEQINKIPDTGFYVTGPDIGRPLRYVSESMTEILGYSVDEFAMMYKNGYRDFFYAPDYEQTIRRLEKIYSDKARNYVIEYHCIRKDGSLIWVLCRGHLIHDRKNAPAYLCVLTDISEYKQAEEKQRINGEEYRTAAVFGNDIIYRFNIASGDMYMPEDLAAKYHLPSILKNVPYSVVKQGYLLKECISSYVSFFKAIRMGTEGKTADIGRTFADGSVHWYRGRYRILRDREGKPAEAIVIFNDITEEKSKNTEILNLREKERMLHDLTGNFVRNIIKYNIADDRLELMDRQTEKFLPGIKKDAFSVNLFRSDLIDAESMQSMHQLFQDMRDGKPNGEFFCRAKNPCGLLRWYKGFYSTSFDRHGKPDYAVLSFNDVTKEHEKEVIYLLNKVQGNRPGKGKKVFKTIYNLSLDTLEYADHGTCADIILPESGSYTGILSDLPERFICPEDRKKFIAFMSEGRLISAFENGISLGTLEFRTAESGKAQKWMKLSYQMYRDPYSEQIKAAFYIEDISEEKEKRESLLRNAEFDAVSGLLNRTAFAERMGKGLKTADKSLVSALVVLDIDHFKEINDKYGHSYGDSILSRVAYTVQTVICKDDISGRIGGDELGICSVNLPDKLIVQNRVDILKNAVSRKLNDSERLTVSIGVAFFPDDGTGFDELYRAADKAMLQAKKQGGDCYVVYSENLPDLNRKPVKTRQTAAGTDADAAKRKIFIRTFGYFDIFVNGKAVPFQYAKTKELLALLVDRRGGFITSDEIISCLWENETANKLTHTRCRKVYLRLKGILEEYGIEDIIETKKSARRIVPEKVQCDLFDFFSGKPESKDQFLGSYMSNYSWGEMTLSDLMSNR